MGWGGGGHSSRRRQTPAQGQEPHRHEQAKDHEQQGDDTRETKTRSGAPHALGRPASPTRPGQSGGAPHALGRPARPSRPGKYHRQATTDNAGRTAEETTAHQQNKPSIQPATTLRTKTRTRRHSRPHQGKGHAQARQSPTKGGARNNTAPTPATQTPQATNTRQRQPYGDGDNRETTKQAEHPAGYNTTNQNPNTPTQQAPPRGGPRTNRARPNRGGGGHAPAQHQPRPSQ